MTPGQQIAKKYWNSEHRAFIDIIEVKRRELANLIDTMHAEHAQKAAEKIIESLETTFPYHWKSEEQIPLIKAIILEP